MGLDMYLLVGEKNKAAEKLTEIFYWRKANQIHGWFDEQLDGVEDCHYHPVTKEQLEEQQAVCKKVLDHSKLVKNEAGEKVLESSLDLEEVLPTMAGFFFGSTDYDVYYLSDVKDTYEGLSKVLADTDFENEQVYYMAWW